MQEILNFAFKPGESLKGAYQGLARLCRETRMRSPRDAAEDYLNAIPVRHRQMVSNQVHFHYSMDYTLKQVYEVAERMIPADVYSSAYQERLSRGGSNRWQAGQSSTNQVERSQVVVTRRERTANAVDPMEKCPRCLGPHSARECD